MVRSFNASVGTNSRKPEVGFGVVGRNTLVTGPLGISWIWPSVSPVMKPMAQDSGRGYWISTTSRKALDFCSRTAVVICLVAP